MEILAACGSDSRVPEPGRQSFTYALIRAIRRELNASKTVGIRALTTLLWDDRSHPRLKGKQHTWANKSPTNDHRASQSCILRPIET